MSKNDSSDKADKEGQGLRKFIQTPTCEPGVPESKVNSTSNQVH